jgi:hypothetical protein
MQTSARERNAVSPLPSKSKQVSVSCVFAGPTRHGVYWALLSATDTPPAPVLTNFRFSYICICVSYDSHNTHQYWCFYDCHPVLTKTLIFVFRMSTYTSICPYTVLIDLSL